MLDKKTLDTDLCVIGGGLAGICTAISAAREGVRVVLMHERPVLGGNSSSEIRMHVCGAESENNRETGIMEELALENLYRNPTRNYYIWDSVLYDFVLREKNITLLLNCTCMDAQTETGSFAHGRSVHISSVTGYQMTTQTFFNVNARYFADCSGDSILAPLTGAQFRMGRESADEFGEDTSVKKADNYTMGMSCLIEGRELTTPVKYTPPRYSTKLNADNFKFRTPNIHSSYENFWYLELGGDRDTIRDTEDVSRSLAALAAGTWDYIKNSGDYDADNFELEFLGFLPGKRESRRMVGEYIITERDIYENRTFPDTAAYGGWPLDDHFPEGFYCSGAPNTSVPTPAPYSIPYRCLYSKNVDNLFFAGRNISMTHMAMSSMRVMATCAVIGQAAGTAAAIASKYGVSPHDIYIDHIDELQRILTDNDCFLPGVKRNVGRLCLDTPVLSGDESLKNGEDRPNRIYSGKCGVTVKNGKALEYRFDKAQHIDVLHITFDSDLNRETLEGDFCVRTKNVHSNVLLGTPHVYVPKTLCRSFAVEVTGPTGTRRAAEADDNLCRAHHIKLDADVTCIRLIPYSNWGGSDTTTVFSFDFR